MDWSGDSVGMPYREKPLIPYLWIVWSLYVSGFTALVVVIFMQDVEKLDKSKFFGPNGLIATLSLLLALLVLLLITEISATESFKFNSEALDDNCFQLFGWT